jgi:hypothetical protein
MFHDPRSKCTMRLHEYSPFTNPSKPLYLSIYLSICIHDITPPSTRSDPIRSSPPRTKSNNNDDEIFHHSRPTPNSFSVLCLDLSTYREILQIFLQIDNYFHNMDLSRPISIYVGSRDCQCVVVVVGCHCHCRCHCFGFRFDSGFDFDFNGCLKTPFQPQGCARLYLSSLIEMSASSMRF